MITRRSEKPARAPETPGLDPILDFMRLLWNVEHRLQSASKLMEATLGITGPQRLVLRIVTERPGLSPGDLARSVHLHPSTITGILQRLVKKRLLARERDPSDSRRVRLRARPAATKYVAASSGTVEAAVTRALSRISSNGVRHAREVLSAIADALAENAGNKSSARRKPGRPRGRVPG
jgi:MarR family transcriptional regulator, organic hydroperoxide resistance regulator